VTDIIDSRAEADNYRPDGRCEFALTEESAPRSQPACGCAPAKTALGTPGRSWPSTVARRMPRPRTATSYEGAPGRYRPPDKLLVFLEAL
jgi:hypothetical protein